MHRLAFIAAMDLWRNGRPTPNRNNPARTAKRRQFRAERASRNGVVLGLTGSSPMNAPTSLDETIRRAQDILWSALPPGVARSAAVVELKELLWSTQTREALALASDNYLAFALRESRMALADASAWPDKTLSALWTILDDPALNAALGIPHDFCANAARRDHPWR
jgi:hypothetical protein